MTYLDFNQFTTITILMTQSLLFIGSYMTVMHLSEIIMNKIYLQKEKKEKLQELKYKKYGILEIIEYLQRRSDIKYVQAHIKKLKEILGEPQVYTEQDNQYIHLIEWSIRQETLQNVIDFLTAKSQDNSINFTLRNTYTKKLNELNGADVVYTQSEQAYFPTIQKNLEIAIKPYVCRYLDTQITRILKNSKKYLIEDKTNLNIRINEYNKIKSEYERISNDSKNDLIKQNFYDPSTIQNKKNIQSNVDSFEKDLKKTICSNFTTFKNQMS